jgi:hypothetical protein
MKIMTSAAAWEFLVYVFIYSTVCSVVLIGVILFLVSVGAWIGRWIISLDSPYGVAYGYDLRYREYNMIPLGMMGIEGWSLMKLYPGNKVLLSFPYPALLEESLSGRCKGTENYNEQHCMRSARKEVQIPQNRQA